MIEFGLWLIWSIITIGVAEYLIHKYTMHRRFFCNKWLGWIFEEHAIEHHKKDRYDINVDLPLYFHFLIGGPLFILLYCVSPLGFAAFLLVCIHHSVYWSKLHRATHDLEHNWSEWFPSRKFYFNMRNHHLLHHIYPNRNFGVVWPWTDHLFHTKVYH
jgi:hypothetical protein